MIFNTLTFCILLAHSSITHTESTIIEFITPEFIKKNEPYRLIIKNSNSREKFPIDGFVFAFELLKSVNPREEFSIADVTSDSFKEDEYRGFSIRNFIIRKDLIEMLIEFRKEAHNMWFRIRYTSAKTDSEKETFFVKDTGSNIIFERKIEMFLPYTITIQVGFEPREVTPSDKDAIGNVLLPEKNGKLRCHAKDGLPNPKPEFINKNQLIGATEDIVNTEVIELIWLVRLQDHGKNILCRAGREINNVTLNVYHYMTDVVTDPMVGDTLFAGSSIKCFNKDGFPIPKTKWVFVSGPPESSKYYELRDNDSILFVNVTAPISSNWTFECLGSSDMPVVVAKYLSGIPPTYPIKRIFNFTIESEITRTLVQSSDNSVMGVVIIILVLIIVSGTVVGFIFKSKILKFLQDKRLGPDQRKKDKEILPLSQQPIDPGYKYTVVPIGKVQRNGTDKDDVVCYTEIVATVQPKSENSATPIEYL